MKKTKSIWWQPEGWMRLGSYLVVGLVLLYLGFIVWGILMPRLRFINKAYETGSITRIARLAG